MERLYELMQKETVRHGVIYTERWDTAPRRWIGRPYDGAVVDKDGNLVIPRRVSTANDTE